jgi:hypothetical protein
VIVYFYRDELLEALKRRHLISETPEKPDGNQKQ